MDPPSGPPRKTVALKPVVADVSGCSDPSWWRDANGVCWPSAPDGHDGGSGGDEGGSGDDGGGGGTPGGGGATPTDEPVANDEDADCIDLGCKLREPTAAEKQKILDLINNRLRNDGFCAQVKASALAMVERNLQVWDNTVYAKNAAGQDARLLGAAP